MKIVRNLRVMILALVLGAGALLPAVPALCAPLAPALISKAALSADERSAVAAFVRDELAGLWISAMRWVRSCCRRWTA